MARGSQAANTGATAAQGISNQSSANAGALYGVLAPELESQIANPQGMSPTDLAAANTASQESAGGSEAAAVGQGALRAARTHNAGTADAAIGEGTRGASQALSKAALGTQLANARMKEGERQAATSGLEGLYGTNTGASVNALGEVAQNVNANTNAENASWDWAKYILDPAMAAAGQAGAAAAG